MAGYRGIGVVFARRTARAAGVESAVIQRLPPAMRETFVHANMSGWVPMGHATEIFVQVAPLVYPTAENALRELGRALARDNLGGPYKHFVRLMSVPFLMKQTALMWRAYHNAGRTEVEMLGAREVTLRVSDYPDLPERFRECMCGWIEQAIAMTGGKNVCVTKSEQGFGAKGAKGDPKPQMFNQGFGAKDAAGDPQPQMFNQGFGAQGAEGDSKPQMYKLGFGAQGAAGDPKPHMFKQDAVHVWHMTWK